MSWRAAHGNGKKAGIVRIETLPADELPTPLDSVPVLTKNGYAPLGKGGASKIKLSHGLLAVLPKDGSWAVYAAHAEQFRKHQIKALAMQAGGRCGAAPSAIVASAALQLAASRWLFENGAQMGDVAMLKAASSLANDSRQNLLAAYELAIREGQAREKFRGGNDPHALLEAALVQDIPPKEE